jgi:hypothetical protein
LKDPVSLERISGILPLVGGFASYALERICGLG